MRAQLDPDDLSAGAELVLRRSRSDDERRVAFEPEGERDKEAHAYVDLRDLAPVGGDDEWALQLSVGGDPPAPMTARKGVAGRKSRIVPGPDAFYRLRAKVLEGDVPVVRCRSLPPHAEVTRVEVEDEAIAIEGEPPGAEGDLRLVAVSRRDKAEHTAPVAIEGGHFKTRLPLAQLAREGDTDAWNLWLEQGDERLRLSSHRDDILDKASVVVFPTRVALVGAAARRVRPYYTVRNRLGIRPVPLATLHTNPAYQSLGEHALEGSRDHVRLNAQVDKAGQRAHRIVGMERGHDQMPRDGRLNRDQRGLGVPHLANHQHVRVLPQNAS